MTYDLPCVEGHESLSLENFPFQPKVNKWTVKSGTCGSCSKTPFFPGQPEKGKSWYQIEWIRASRQGLPTDHSRGSFRLIFKIFLSHKYDAWKERGREREGEQSFPGKLFPGLSPFLESLPFSAQYLIASEAEREKEKMDSPTIWKKNQREMFCKRTP